MIFLWRVLPLPVQNRCLMMGQGPGGMHERCRRGVRGARGLLAVAFLACVTVSSARAQSAAGAGIGGVMIGAHLVEPKAAPPPPGIGPMYQAYAIVTGTDMRQRPWGFARCLREVLVKVAGDPRLANDPRVAALTGHADRFVAAFAYTDLMAADALHDDQGTFDRPYRLMVYFDPKRIDAALGGLGEQPWRGPRPAVVPVLRVGGPNAPAYLLSAESQAGREQLASFALAAQQLGMQVRFPTSAMLAGWGISPADFPSARAAPPADAAAPAADEMVVLGTLEWSETLPGWIGRWHTAWHGRSYSWGIRGVNYDAAFGNLLSGAVLLASGRGSPQ